MKIKIFLFSLVFCFFAFTASSFALTSSSIAALINDSPEIPDEYKVSMIANINSGKYVADSRGILFVPSVDLSSYTGVTLVPNPSVCYFFYGNGLSNPAKLIKLSDDGYSISEYIGKSTLPPNEYYTNSILCNVPGSVNKGGLELFLAPTGSQAETPQGANLRELIQVPSGRLMNHFGETSTTLLIAGIVIFSLLLVVPLIPRLVRLFL